MKNSAPILNVSSPSATPSEEGESRNYQLKTVGTSITGYMVEGFDLLMIGFLISAITVALSVTPTEAGALVSWSLLGTVAGGVSFGIISDKYGRVFALKWGIALYMVFTTLCYFSVGYTDLLIYRFFVGFAMGGEFGIGMTLVAEAWPAKKRARASSYVGLGWQSGVLMAAILPPLLIPLIGWKGMFLVGLVPAVIAFIMRSRLREPEIFLKAKRSQSVKNKFSLKLLFADKATTKTTIGIVILTSVQNFGYYGLMIWLPTFMANNLGFSLSKSSVWTAVTIIGMGIGIWLFGRLSDRFGRKPIFITYQLGAFVMVLVYTQLTDPTILLFAGALMGLFVNGMLAGFGVLISENYPTEIRATAQNILFNIGRGVGATGPLIVGLLATTYSFTYAIALLASIYVIDIIATVFLIKESKGVSLK
ncbi:MFS transporter [Providencia sp. Me31A]|uniref:MFS transporter n=1 Tax=Providencia sp. Me31A TaxID=3392637 RepID=UPI003D2E4535